MRIVCEVDESVLGRDFHEGVLGLKRFIRLLQDLLDEEGLPIDVRIGVTSSSAVARGMRELRAHIPEWILVEAKRQFDEPLPD